MVEIDTDELFQNSRPKKWGIFFFRKNFPGFLNGGLFGRVQLFKKIYINKKIILNFFNY